MSWTGPNLYDQQLLHYPHTYAHVHAYMRTQKKCGISDSLTGSRVIVHLKRGFIETWGELTVSKSCVLDGDDRALAVCPDYTLSYGTERHHW